jgi:hypothetical protein
MRAELDLHRSQRPGSFTRPTEKRVANRVTVSRVRETAVTSDRLSRTGPRAWGFAVKTGPR